MKKEEFADIRTSLDLTQFKLADKLGVTGRYVGNLERGVTPIKPSIAMAMRFLFLQSIWANHAKNTAREWLEVPLAILDTETTGLSETDQVIEIGVVDENGQVLLDSLIKPTVSISEDSQKIHGITNEAVKGAISFSELLPKLIKACEGRKIIIYNSNFDNRLLLQSTQSEGEKAMLQSFLSDSRYCLMELFAMYHGEISEKHGFKWKSLGFAAEHFNVPVIGAHRALADCQMALGVLKGLAS